MVKRLFLLFVLLSLWGVLIGQSNTSIFKSDLPSDTLVLSSNSLVEEYSFLLNEDSIYPFTIDKIQNFRDYHLITMHTFFCNHSIKVTLISPRGHISMQRIRCHKQYFLQLKKYFYFPIGHWLDYTTYSDVWVKNKIVRVPAIAYNYLYTSPHLNGLQYIKPTSNNTLIEKTNTILSDTILTIGEILMKTLLTGTTVDSLISYADTNAVKKALRQWGYEFISKSPRARHQQDKHFFENNSHSSLASMIDEIRKVDFTPILSTDIYDYDIKYTIIDRNHKLSFTLYRVAWQSKKMLSDRGEIHFAVQQGKLSGFTLKHP